MKKIGDKQFTTTAKNKLNFFKEEKKENIKNNSTMKAVAKTESLSITY